MREQPLPLRKLALLALLGMLAVCFCTISKAGARTGRQPTPCSVAFPGSRTKTIGKTTWYNRQSSVQNVVCFGFGLNPSADFPISADMVCGLVSQTIGVKAEKLGLFVDGACSGMALAADPSEPAQYIRVACAWISDLLEKTVKPAGIAAGIGCTFAPSVGHAFGGIIESKHELDVAADIIGRDKCLKYSPTHFGSPWLAVSCGARDLGFSNLPTAVPMPCPSATLVLAAWRSSPGVDVAVPGSVNGFGTPHCWRNWVLADVIGNGNGTFLFSQTPSLHGVSEAEDHEFDEQVCASSNAPILFREQTLGSTPSCP